MNQLEAIKIFEVWKEWCYPNHFLLFSIFQSDIPESFLPYPKHILEEALNIVAKYYFDSGEHERSKTIQTSMAWLIGYIKDEDAFSNAAKYWTNPKAIKMVIDCFTSFKNEWIEWIKKKEDSASSKLH